MPPKKASAFEQLAKKAKSSGVRKAVPGSAFEMIRRKNEYRRTGIKRRYDDDDNDDNIPSTPPVKRPKTTKPPKPTGTLATVIRNYGGGTAILQRPLQVSKPRPTHPNPPPSPSPKPVEIESWRPFGGEHPPTTTNSQSPTNTLALARLSTWRVKTFVADVEKLMRETGGEVLEIKTQVMVHGGESVSDVWAVFGDAVEADLMRDRIQGALVGGRKLQVGFA